MAWESTDDSQLLQLAQSGEAEAFGALYERYALPTFRFLYANLENRMDAEDLTEEVFLKAWRSLPKYRDTGIPFSAYLMRIGRNALIDHYRKNGRGGYPVPIDEENDIEDTSYNTSELVSAKIEYQELKYILNQLREDYRIVLVLRYLSGLSPEETAQVMNRTVGAVRVLQHRALEAVRKLLESETERKNGNKSG